jgi:2-dehydro-3-deoxyphosphogluconate aldolase/(4S)-4-hydroxy-2-oxoglutarate aldolase
MNSVLKSIGRCRLVPVIAIDNAKDAAPLGQALVAGELPCAEVTFRTAAAADSIAAMAKIPGLLLGAGTVLKVDQVKQAIDLGATFMVAPGFNPKVVGYCVEQGITVIPGVSNPTDIEMALEFGLDVVKFFPAEAMGGLAALKAISAPYGGLSFVPTGGITESNLPVYLAFPKVLACGGSWMVKPELIAGGKFSQITTLVKAAVDLAHKNSA